MATPHTIDPAVVKSVLKLDSLAELAFGGSHAAGIVGLPKLLTAIIFWVVFVIQIVSVWIIVFSKSLLCNPLDGSGLEVDFKPGIDNPFAYGFMSFMTIILFSSLLTADTMLFFWAMDSNSDEVDLCIFVALLLVHFLMSVVLCIGVGFIMAAGHTVDNVIKNGLAVFVVMQFDDAVLAMLNAYGDIKGHPNWTIQHFKKKRLEQDDQRALMRCLFFTSFICYFIVSVTTWGARLSIDFDC